jgi:hypothetical protein
MKFEPGDIIGLTRGPDAPIVRITNASDQSISYESADGHGEIVLPSIFMSLDEKMDGARPATPEEAARFAAHFRPAPENWN